LLVTDDWLFMVLVTEGKYPWGLVWRLGYYRVGSPFPR